MIFFFFFNAEFIVTYFFFHPIEEKYTSNIMVLYCTRISPTTSTSAPNHDVSFVRWNNAAISISWLLSFAFSEISFPLSSIRESFRVTRPSGFRFSVFFFFLCAPCTRVTTNNNNNNNTYNIMHYTVYPTAHDNRGTRPPSEPPHPRSDRNSLRPNVGRSLCAITLHRAIFI